VPEIADTVVPVGILAEPVITIPAVIVPVAVVAVKVVALDALKLIGDMRSIRKNYFQSCI
jgi:hypothetical protein